MVVYRTAREFEREVQSTPVLGWTSEFGRVDYSMFSARFFGRASIRLLVFAPGSTRSQRLWVGVLRWLTVRELHVLLSIILCVVAAAVVGIDAVLAVCLAVGITAATIGTAWLFSRDLLRRAQGVEVRVSAGGRGADPSIGGDAEFLDETVGGLDRLAKSDLSPVERAERFALLFAELERRPCVGVRGG